ncbi:AI-2E family transporter, partial [Salmonella enterica subsp. enterica serovar Kentucky]|nr:AI-2E family transporter [Salmonella enterica subsp. enterica serovar Kentucky]
QLLVFYSGMYTLEIVKGTDLLNAFFRSGLNCTVLALTLNTCALFLVVHMVIGNIMEPRMMGHRLGMSTLVVFLSLLVWGWLLG